MQSKPSSTERSDVLVLFGETGKLIHRKISPTLHAIVRREWVTTVFPRRGHYACDPHILWTYPPADLAIERIGDPLDYDVDAFFRPARAVDGKRETT